VRTSRLPEMVSSAAGPLITSTFTVFYHQPLPSHSATALRSSARLTGDGVRGVRADGGKAKRGAEGEQLESKLGKTS
jgi:hypothetical protein